MRGPLFWMGIVLVVLFIAFLIGGTNDAFPHDSKWGWPYPTDCCSQHGDECRDADGEVTFEDNGYRFLGEWFPAGDPRVRLSGDGHWHVCRTNLTWCVIVPEGGMG